MSKRAFKTYKSPAPPRGWHPRSPYEPKASKAKLKAVVQGAR